MRILQQQLVGGIAQRIGFGGLGVTAGAIFLRVHISGAPRQQHRLATRDLLGNLVRGLLQVNHDCLATGFLYSADILRQRALRVVWLLRVRNRNGNSRLQVWNLPRSAALAAGRSPGREDSTNPPWPPSLRWPASPWREQHGR